MKNGFLIEFVKQLFGACTLGGQFVMPVVQLPENCNCGLIEKFKSNNFQHTVTKEKNFNSKR
jgi:hypothetical protein